MEITWYVEDGYANPGPQHSEIDDADLEGLTREEKKEFIEQFIQDEFEARISWACDVESYLRG